ncbi:MAG: OmpA family protein, partial [Desulfuromonadales bacterium]|nr:OmpA family protein [Desulfuromonadales bacterium]
DFMSPSVEHVVAMDGVAVVVNNANQLSTLTLEQIASLFSGAIRDWSEVPASGLSGPVQIYARDEKSGTYDTFNSLVLHPSKQKISPGARRFEDSQELSNLVAADPLGIGFIGLPYINPSKAVAVQEKGSRPIFPTPFTVATEDYPLSRRLYLYLPQTASPVARDFIHFATTDSGQQIAESVGFIKLSVFEQQRAQAKAGEAPEEYRDIARQARRLSMTFHFDSGGTRLDNKAIQDLSRIVDYLNQETNRTRKISLFGFADNLGNPEKNCEISLERARTVEEALAAFGIFAQRSKGLCDRIPIASNETANGRNKNRRVEVWIN